VILLDGEQVIQFRWFGAWYSTGWKGRRRVLGKAGTADLSGELASATMTSIDSLAMFWSQSLAILLHSSCREWSGPLVRPCARKWPVEKWCDGQGRCFGPFFDMSFHPAVHSAWFL
jgi:hypothetical protein